MQLSRRRQPDFAQFLKVLTRSGRPGHLPFYEHVASPEFISSWTGKPLGRMLWGGREYWQTFVDFWIGMGFDCVPMEIALNCPLPSGHGDGIGFASESKIVFRNRDDFERYPWPGEDRPIDFHHFEIVASLLPAGAKIVGGVCMGPYEWASQMMGTVGLSYLLADDPELVEMVFARLGRLLVAADRKLAAMDCIGALRQGDDLGFKTSTFLSPDLLRKLVFPIYKTMAATAHAAGKPFILHSCGNLDQVYDDLAATGIDAKHSFEEVILPVEQFKARYAGRVTPLGGLDVDLICRGTPEQIRTATRRKIEQCFADGYWALGTGNSLTDYMPVENYAIALDEGLSVR